MDIQQRQVVIIGAGPSGSTAAALLLKQGIDVLVVEKA
ncbi:FAD-dependent monooxygenase, partial [Vibrio furnissii]